MMRHPTHAQLDQFALVKATKAFFRLMGFRATHQRLAQFIPVVGIAMNAGINAASIILLSERAQEAYRLRFLTEKYGLDASEWLSKVEPAQPGDEDDSIDLDQVINEAKKDDEPGEA